MKWQAIKEEEVIAEADSLDDIKHLVKNDEVRFKEV